jgi:hypothetical protein
MYRAWVKDLLPGLLNLATCGNKCHFGHGSNLASFLLVFHLASSRSATRACVSVCILLESKTKRASKSGRH